MSERQFLKLLFYLLLFSTGIVGLSVFLLSGVAIYRLASEKPEPEKQTQIYDMATRQINLTEKILLLLAGGGTIIGSLREIQLNRSKSGHEFLVANILDNALKKRDELVNNGLDIYSKSPCVETAITKGSHRYLIISFLNYLDYMCIAVDKEIIDEELVKKSAKYLILKSWDYFKPAIQEFRKINNAEEAWKEIENKCEVWS
ncbi:DUF4760 domain-containing protein [Microcystis aeruginosa]|jgi:hypothetical protein|uniref:DUF4760 domain-containing protein n=1 Tax=Microcystis aeruginosa Ma_QC_C_20070703_M131 TaxID=2486263 RepID=A0A551Y1X2_MICAE|nr:DUF4760 domain-containing protein [Microcystis aeruginosa]MDB9391522.1 DUF4760 domain-containing protein [Microcystis aeruginosa CS-579]TRT54965.1 MAG: DUF4760 domain-containing protein [Microcystis aeruginosa Ma_QC_C_20070703_M131]